MKLLPVSLLIVLTTACSGNALDNPSSDAAADSAAAYGRRDAAVFENGQATDMEKEAAILNIRYKEAHMRACGYDKAADAYIDAAKQMIPDSITAKK